MPQQREEVVNEEKFLGTGKLSNRRDQGVIVEPQTQKVIYRGGSEGNIQRKLKNRALEQHFSVH